MSNHRHMRGAPAQYGSMGQAHGARTQQRAKAGHGERMVLDIMRNNPKKIRALYPRIGWAEVVQRGGAIKRAFESANECETDLYALRQIPERLRHQAALALYDCGAPIKSVRGAVELAWNAHAALFMALAGSETYPIMRHCQFEPPADLGPVFPVWRGVRGATIEAARAGHSWTTIREVATTWAAHLGVRDKGRISGQMLVLRREIRTQDVIYYSDDHGMAEIVIDAEPDGAVDGEPAEWMATAESFAWQMSVEQMCQRVFGA